MLAVWLAQIGRALGAPVELPAGADVSAWRTALLLSDLEVVPSGSLGDRPGARMTQEGASLSIWARDIYGAEHIVTVPVPTTTRAREAAAALAASLVQPVSSASISLPALPPLPAPAPRPKPAPPRPAPAPPEPVAVADPPEPLLEVSSAQDPVPDSVIDVTPPEPPTPPASSAAPPLVVVREPPDDALLLSWVDGWFASAGPSLRLRPGIRSMGALSISAGRSRGPWALAAGVEIVAPALLLDIDGDRRLSALDVRVMPSWRAGRLELGASLGVSGRYASDERQPPPPALLPTAGLSLSGRARISPSLSVVPGARLDLDLIRSGIGYYSGELLLLSPLSASVGVSGLFGRR